MALRARLFLAKERQARAGALNCLSQAAVIPSTAAHNTARDQLETSQTLPGVENYQQWRERNQLAGNLSVKDSAGNVTGFLTPNQTAQRYLDEMKARPGWRKLADNISTSLTAGGGQVVAGVLGAEALAKNSFQSLTGLDVGGQAASEAAADMARQNQALTQSHELTVDGLDGRVVSGVAQAGETGKRGQGANT